MAWLNRSEVIPPKTQYKAVSSGLLLVAGIVLIVSACVLIYKTNIQTVTANYATTRGIVYGFNNDFSSAVSNYEKATSYDIAGRYEYRNRYAQFLLDSNTKLDFTKDNVQSAFKEVIALEEKNAVENPEDYLPELYLSRLNITLGKSDPKSPYNDIALAHSLKALSYSETFVRTYYEIGQAYLNKKDYANALIQFQKATDLNPEVGISWWYLGAVEMQSGQTDKGLADMIMAIKKGYALGENDYLNLVNVYIKKADYKNLIIVYQGLIKLKPTNASYMAALAAAYANAGLIDEAVAQARLTVQLDPSFEPSAKQFVNSLGRTW